MNKSVDKVSQTVLGNGLRWDSKLKNKIKICVKFKQNLNHYHYTLNCHQVLISTAPEYWVIAVYW